MILLLIKLSIYLSIYLNQNLPTVFRGMLLSERTHDLQTEKTVLVYCLLFRIRPPKRVQSIGIINHW